MNNVPMPDQPAAADSDATGPYQPTAALPSAERFATLGQPVSLKFLPPYLRTDPDWLARFRKENILLGVRYVACS
jgi:hypothetical protein